MCARVLTTPLCRRVRATGFAPAANFASSFASMMAQPGDMALDHAGAYVTPPGTLALFNEEEKRRDADRAARAQEERQREAAERAKEALEEQEEARAIRAHEQRIKELRVSDGSVDGSSRGDGDGKGW